MPASPFRKAAFLALTFVPIGCRSGPLTFAKEELPVKPFRVEQLADGVHLFHPADPSTDRTNSLVVEQDEGLVVIDAQPSVEAARELLAAIAEVSKAPIRFLVLTHPHAEAAGGASAFPASAVRIGSKGCSDAMADTGYDFGAEERLRSKDPETWKEPDRSLPVLALKGSVVLEDKKHPVELDPLVPSHSRGDLLVSIPDTGIYAVGGLVSPDRNPYAGDANGEEWLITLNQIASLAPRVVVPLRGPVLGATDVRIQRDSMAWVRGQLTQGYVDALPSEKIPDTVMASPSLSQFFDVTASPSFVRGVVVRIFREMEEERRRKGAH